MVDKKNFSFKILSQDKKSLARAGIIHTRSGKIETPYLVPVATRGFIISLTPKDYKKLKIQALLANTYHLHFMPPGDEEIKKAGGLHKTMQFSKPIFTDSGGFQALSLGIGRQRNMRKLGFFPKDREISQEENNESFAEMTPEGIMFTSTYNKEKRFISPKKSMEIQSNLNSDIIMAFDQCNCAGDTKKETLEAMNRSHLWEIESLTHHNKSQALYGIIHGGAFPDLRKKSTRFIKSKDFEGIAVGGSLGKTKSDMYSLLSIIMQDLHEDKRPRHMLGIGWVDDIFECVSLGMDTFDCVEMTRIARHRSVYISPESGGSKINHFKTRVNQTNFSTSKKIDKLCKCPTCKKFNRKQFYELYLKDRRLFNHYATMHNIFFMATLMECIRKSIKQGKFQQLKKKWLKD
ncbi:tRNA guanosine(34) transglycosylase Tgt [Candidatus Pacearchaeota archaeon CG10_big_fil_rev_8_21_14_0_10_34_76]|nr:MAG: tRNA guanosine(34) transglycosylase Tgt [Candidatus Pacearchaeota archaeon CG10_big_fil_rev_8_21_14_0_10_34_76]